MSPGQPFSTVHNGSILRTVWERAPVPRGISNSGVADLPLAS